MSIATNSKCLMCLLKSNLEIAGSLGTEEQTMAFAREMLRLFADAPEDATSPWFNCRIALMLNRHYGLPLDRYRKEKMQSNAFVMERFQTLHDKVFRAPDPVFAGIQYSILGNYLDFAALRGQVSFDTLNEMLDNALEMKLDREVFAQLSADLETAKTLVYVTDNAGEIAFDRICAEAIASRYPDLQITFCVRGDISQNDATREDAEAVGIPFPIIDNGNSIPGTQMDMLSEEAAQALHSADVIFAKGMGNVETMYGCGLNVYYAFLIKCERFVERFQNPMFTPMLMKER